MRYEVQVDGRIANVEANSHGDAISKVLSSMHKPKAVMVCELIEGAIKEYKPAMATVHESVQVDWMLAKDGSWDGEKLVQFARIMRQGEPWLPESQSAGQVTEATPILRTVLEQWKPEQMSIGACRGTAVASSGAVLGTPAATARAVSQDTPPDSVAINYDPITDEASPAFHIHGGHAYRLATVKDLGATVWVSDHNFEAAIAEYPEKLVSFQYGVAEPFATVMVTGSPSSESTWKYAYVQDDSLLQSESVILHMEVSEIMEDDTLVGPPPASREKIEKLNADWEQAVAEAKQDDSF